MSERNRFHGYIICTSPRSGSTLLCDLLTSTGIAGKPASHFHEPSIDEWLDDYNIEPASDMIPNEVRAMIFGAAIARGRGDTGVFGLRMQRHSFAFFIEQLGLFRNDRCNDLERLTATFGKLLFIHLTRSDKIAQAISYVKAEQSGLWHVAPDGHEIERLAPPREPVYDGPLLNKQVKEFEMADHEWQNWFAEQEITPLQLTYDELSIDPIAVLRRVLTLLRLDPMKAEGVEPGTARLADSTNEDWSVRLRAELKIT